MGMRNLNNVPFTFEPLMLLYIYLVLFMLQTPQYFWSSYAYSILALKKSTMYIHVNRERFTRYFSE